RAAEALRVVGDPDVASALVDALVTTHQFQVGRDTPKDTYAMDSRGGFSFGGGNAKVKKVDMKNPAVRTALVELTGENFGFDQDAWRRWLATRMAKTEVDLRRDS
ncbi:MAG: hypothetical protein KDA37_09580, partial [Planctomycetales bacterium]|nr:hypothetical protein [Planctomycetales bacterium]